MDKAALRDSLEFIPSSLGLQDQPDTYTVLAPCDDDQHPSVKVSFFGGISFGRVGQPERTDDGKMLVASLDDLMAAKVILQRVAAKDHRDVTALIAADVSLAKGLASARQFYGFAFQPSEALKALVSFEGGDLNTLTESERKTLVEAVAAVRELPEVTLASTTLADSSGDLRRAI